MSEPSGSEEYLERIVDRAALREFLVDSLGEVDTYDVQLLGVGHSNETLLVTWGRDELVIRRPPPGEVASSAHDVLREYHVIDALQDTDVRVPRTVLECADHSVIGSDFYVMAAVSGDVIRDTEPERFQRPTARERIGQELLDRLVDIHQVDVQAVGLEDLGHPAGFTARQVERWTKQLDWAREVTASKRPVPEIDRVGNWLASNVPEEYPHTLVHGDYKLDNVMFGPEREPTIASVFDWELSTLGDPLTDLGWMLTFWWDPGDPDPPASTGDLYPDFMRHEDYPTRAELIARYEEQTGFTFDNSRFYRLLGVYKLAALGEMFFRRHLESNADDPLYPEMREGVLEIRDRAIRILEGTE